MKSSLKRVVYWVLRRFGEGFANPNFSWRLLLRHVLIQRVFRINAHVPWPVHWTSQVKGVEHISKGSRCPGLALSCYLDGRNGIIIGQNTWIGPHVRIVSMNHDVNDYYRFRRDAPIMIGDNCWLATGCTILPGVTLCDHVVVAAGSVVTKSFPDNDILIAGVPAEIVKKLPAYGSVGDAHE